MKLKTSRRLIFCFFLILFVYSCQHPFDVEYDETFTIKFSESYDDQNHPSNPMLFLSIRTDSSYGRIFALKSDFFVISNTILVKILGVDSSRAVLLGVEGPHAESYKLDLKNNQYQLRIEYQDYSDEYYVNINSKSIEIESQYNSFTHPEYLTYWRYPEKSFMYHYTSSNEIEDEFLKVLSTDIKIQEFKFPLYGKIGYPNWEDNSHTTSFKYFYYENESDFEKAGVLLQSYLNDTLSTSGYNRIYLLNWRSLSFNKYF